MSTELRSQASFHEIIADITCLRAAIEDGRATMPLLTRRHLGPSQGSVRRLRTPASPKHASPRPSSEH